jgi:L-ascorbate metabolism protein UlaG (beta-lactamase superfamily)
MTRPGAEMGTEVPQVGSFRDFWKWRKSRKGLIRSHKARGEAFPPVRKKADALLRSSQDSVTWSGHASVITRLDGKTILSDPVWGNRIAMGVVKRLAPAGPDWAEVPAADLITISHNHYDHHDAGTLRRVKRDTPVVVPRGDGAWFRRRRYQRVHEFDWWQTQDVDGLRVTFVPSQHFSGRTLWDRNKSLFGGWIVQGKRHSAYHSGDTGYFRGFQQIGEKFPKLDVACLPIGAYEPRWFMRPIHTDPEEAGQAFLDTGATRLLPIHWGAFRLTDEAMDEPPKRIRQFFTERRLEPERLLLTDLGETRPLGADE